MLPTKFWVSGPFGSEEAKIRFSRWQPWYPVWISRIGKFLATFDLQVTLPSFKSIGLSFQERKRKHIFKVLAILDFPLEQSKLFFYLQVTRMLPTKFQDNWPWSSGEEAKNRFSRWRLGNHLGFLTGTILAIFDLQVTP